MLGSAPVAVAAEGALSGGEDEQPEGMVERSDGRPMVVMSVRLSATLRRGLAIGRVEAKDARP